jgi:transcriptional regulator with XRE-family HTH domain
MQRPKSTPRAKFFDTGYALIAPVQIKMARAAVGLGIRELAELAECAPSTILRFEGGKGGMQSGTLARLQKALEKEGVVFLEADEKYGPGVRLRSKR